MAKEKKSKKGCWLKVLYGILILLLIIGATLLVYYMNFKPTVDARLQDLLNQSFDTTQFTDQVSSHKADLGQKLNACTNSSSICNADGDIDHTIFWSSDIRVTSDLDLNKYDIANLCSQLNALTILSESGAEALFGCLAAVRINWILTATTIDYTIIYKMNARYLAQSLSLSSAPEAMYLTITASLDLTVVKPVKSVNVTINQLTGEDNAYCWGKICESLQVGEGIENQLAYLPMRYIEQMNATWQSRYVIKEDFIRIK